MIFRQLFDPETSTYTYLLADAATRDAILVDPVREQVDRDASQIEELGLRLVATVETHVHADHVTGAWLLKQRTGSKIVFPAKSGAAGADRYVGEGDPIPFGRFALETRLTPGHTDGCATYVCSDRTMAFTGDAILIRGSGRTDFQQGDARRLFRSVHDQILSLPDETLLYPGHDYKGRTVTTVAEERAFNPRLKDANTEDDFVRIMSELKLAHPKKIDLAVPANLALGRLEGDAAAAEVLPWAEVTRSVTGAPHVTAEWVSAHLADRAFRLVDVRQPDEFHGPLGHIDGAELVPLGELPAAAGGWDRGAPMVLICRSGGRSDRAATWLEANGFKRVASMVGGMNVWSHAIAAK